MKVNFTETVLRDANQSLIATRMPYEDFEAILPELDKAGYYSLECWGGATFDSCLRYLNEEVRTFWATSIIPTMSFAFSSERALKTASTSSVYSMRSTT